MSTETKEPEERKKLSPELKDLRSEVEDMIAPLKASIDLLLELKTAWEISIQECMTLRNQNNQLHSRVTKVETDNKMLNV